MYKEESSVSAQIEFFLKPLDRQFHEFHRTNPVVYKAFMDSAMEAFQAGVPRVGAKAIVERIRWDHMIRTRGDSFKINNSYVSRYVRLAVKECPYLSSMFEMRGLRS